MENADSMGKERPRACRILAEGDFCPKSHLGPANCHHMTTNSLFLDCNNGFLSPFVASLGVYSVRNCRPISPSVSYKKSKVAGNLSIPVDRHTSVSLCAPGKSVWCLVLMISPFLSPSVTYYKLASPHYGTITKFSSSAMHRSITNHDGDVLTAKSCSSAKRHDSSWKTRCHAEPGVPCIDITSVAYPKEP